MTPKVSPLLNIENGRWDLGEALSPNPWVEQGGVHGPDPDPSEAINHVVDLNGGWNPLPGTSTQHFIGELRPSGVQTPEPSKEAASFEIVVPGSNFPNPSKPHTVVVIAARATSKSVRESERKKDPHVYPGDPAHFGLWGDPLLVGENSAGLPTKNQRTWPWADVMAETDTMTSDYHVVGAYMVDRCSLRPLTFSVQRLRQLRHIVIDQLGQLGVDTTKITFLVAGGSYGGLVSQTLTLLYPEEFHACVSVAYSASQRTVHNDQQGHTFFGSAMGRQETGDGYTLRDAAEWSIFHRITGADLYGYSSVNRFPLGPPFNLGVQRPMYFLAGDEDPVTHGDLWVKLIDPDTGAGYRRDGVVVSPHNVNVRWSVLGKQCHTADVLREPYTSPRTSRRSITTRSKRSRP